MTEEEEIEAARLGLEAATRDLVVNMLRVMAGVEKNRRYLIEQVMGVANNAATLERLGRKLEVAVVMSEVLQSHEENWRDRNDKGGQFLVDVGLQEIVKGSLQWVAGRLLQQPTAEARGRKWITQGIQDMSAGHAELKQAEGAIRQ